MQSYTKSNLYQNAGIGQISRGGKNHTQVSVNLLFATPFYAAIKGWQVVDCEIFRNFACHSQASLVVAQETRRSGGTETTYAY